MSIEIRENIVRYLNDDSYYKSLSSDNHRKRKLHNYYCLRHDAVPVPIKEIGDVFGLIEGYDDHTHNVIPQLLEMNITIYAKRRYNTSNQYQWAVEKNLLLFAKELTL